MSDEQNEAKNVKNELYELPQIADKHGVSDTFIKKEELDLQESNLGRNYIPEFKDYNAFINRLIELKEENKELRDSNKDLKEKYKNTLNAMYNHEQKMRSFFKIFRNEQEDKYKYQLLIEKLKHEVTLLNSELMQQEDKYLRLKNQLSYRIGKRIVSLKNKRDFISLPKQVLTDYIDFKTNLNQQSIEFSKNTKLQLLNFNNSTNHILFKDNCSIILKSQFVSIVLENNIDGNFYLNLYGVKANTSVDIQVKFQALEGSCTFEIRGKNSNTHRIEKGEQYTTTFTMTDDKVFSLFNILSNKGGLKVSFKKLRGVPSCLSIINNDKSIIKKLEPSKVDSNEFRTLNISENNRIVIPALKKPNAVLFEADNLIASEGKELAKIFAEKYIKNKYKSALNILYANTVLGKDEQWLNYINKYLDNFNCSPIKLNNQVNKKLYYRISADKPKDIVGKTKVSIIMPAFNAESTIKGSINSILNQTWTNIELIVVNDCSEDSTWEIIKEISCEDNRVIAINNPSNVGAYVSKNIGLKVATGHYITGHDSDDWAHPQRIENHLKAINIEKFKPRASLTRMIRMEENGYFPFYLEGTFCLDGVLRVASITCMFEANFLRDTLGGWDCSRFGADSEIIARAKMVLGEEFKDYHQVSMICLNAPNSLTNNPIHGVKRGKGLSPSRKFYKDQWTEWHKSLDKDNVYLEFPHLDRKFLVPEGTEIPVKNILRVIENIKDDFDV